MNATRIFEHPARRAHHSESWWTSLFSMLLLHTAREGAPSDAIPLKEYRPGSDWEYAQVGALDVAGLTFSDVLVEAPLTEHLVGETLPTVFCDLRPDLMICQPKRRRITLIENKTIGASIGAQLDTYLAARDHFVGNGWKAETILLISSGYEVTREWESIARTHTPLILWENVLRLVDRIDWLRSLFDVELASYYNAPERQRDEVSGA